MIHNSQLCNVQTQKPNHFFSPQNAGLIQMVFFFNFNSTKATVTQNVSQKNTSCIAK